MGRVVSRVTPVLVLAATLAGLGTGSPQAVPRASAAHGDDGELRGVARSPASVGARTIASVGGGVEGARHQLPLRGPAGSLEARAREGRAPVGIAGRRSAAAPDAARARGAGRTPVPVGSGFDGLPNERPLVSPSDSTGALGLSWYLTAVNSSTSVFSPDGTPQFPPMRLRTLGNVLPDGVFDFDPKVVYDPYDDHFVLVFLATDRPRNFSRSWIVVATVPEATAPNLETWCVTRLAGDQYRRDGRQWADYPGLGYTSDRVTVSTNQFQFDRGYAGAQVISFNKANLYDCGSDLRATVFAGRSTRNPDGTKSFTVQPAQTVGGVEPTVQYLVEFEFRGTNRGAKGEKLVVFRIQRTARGLRISSAQKNVGTARLAPLGTQAGGSLREPDTWWDPGDLRLVNAHYDADANTLHAAHAVQRDIPPSPYLESAIRFYEVQPAGVLRASAVTGVGTIGTSERDSGWPVVATDAAGNLFITYSRAGVRDGGEYLSAHVLEVTPGGEASNTLLAAGEARYEFAPGPERWGDYNGINRDPSDGARVATINQYAIDDGGGGVTQRWQQWVELVAHG
jgi:hypothetical protein